MKLSLITPAILSACFVFAAPALAEDYVLTIKDHKFTPDTLTIPAETKVKLTVKNQDKTPAEFESHDFKREKVIAGGTEASFTVGPFKAGEYHFFDEFHEDTAKGKIIAK